MNKKMKTNFNFCASYSTSSVDKKLVFDGYLNRLKMVIMSEKCLDPYLGKRIAEYQFQKPYLRCVDSVVITLAVMRLLMKYAYNLDFEYAKFTIGYVMRIPTGDVSYTVGTAISLKYSSGDAVPNIDLYHRIFKLVCEKAEIYENEVLSGLYIIVYMEGMLVKELPLSYDEIDNKIFQLLLNASKGGEPQEVQAIGYSKRSYSDKITALKRTRKERQPFIVADTETLLINNVHVPYAAGYLLLSPGVDVAAMPWYEIQTSFTEDDILYIPEFEKRSTQMLFDFIENLATAADQYNVRMVYFHNFSRFDGILLLKYFASYGVKYTVKPLMRNLRLYELSVFRGKKLLYRIRDSYTLLPSSLDTLAKTLCPELGQKGSIEYDKVQVSNLKNLEKELLQYMKQDIRLLGGVMLKAQDLLWTLYQVDIVDCMTLSSLAMKIYRLNYYDPNSFPIHIPSRNEDTFIRRGYYGGHADTYKPYGEDLYYYDVNSLYPYIMKTFAMPGGVPVWDGNLVGQELSKLYGFIEAFVVCPRTITRPFLPYRDQNNTLIFPTGKWVGVYYSEELKYAQDIGYNIITLRGYLFEKKDSPFEGFVSSLSGKRIEAKKKGDDAMAYTYKILMNTLYGRFGINPQSTITEVCDRERYDILIKKDIIFGEKLSERYYIVSYVINKGDVDDSDWKPPRISAVQMAAAITACSRIHMYKYISRPDCYYTDTDSAILGSPLPGDEISSFELGKVKMEYFVKIGIFLAPKSYLLKTLDYGDIIKHKGAAKDLVDAEWFESQFENMSRTMHTTVKQNFRIDWHTLNITKKEVHVSLGIQVGTKREPVYDTNNIWVDTLPKDVIDYGGQESTILKLELNMIQEKYESEIASLKSEIDKKDQVIDSQKSEIDSLKSEIEKVLDILMSDMGKKEQVIASQKSEIDKKDQVIDMFKSELESIKSSISQLRGSDNIKSQSAAKLPEEPVITEAPRLVQPTPTPTLSTKWKGYSYKPKGKGDKPKGKMPKGKKPKPKDTS